jgi:hypothetical protein
MTFLNRALLVITYAGPTVVAPCAPKLLDREPAGNLVRTMDTVEADPTWPESKDATLRGGSADAYVGPETNEVFVADGYFAGTRPATD